MTTSETARDLISKNPNAKPRDLRALLPHLTQGGAAQMLFKARKKLCATPKPAEQPRTKSDVEKVCESHGITGRELEAILNSAASRPSYVHKITRTGQSKKIRFGVISDAHIGHKEFDENLFDYAREKFKEFGCEFILDPGDHFEGMSGRPGHVYELSHIGYQNQKREVVRLYRSLGLPIYGIDGNHDLWYQEKHSMGVAPGDDLANEIKGYTHLGEWEGTLQIDNLRIYLFHGNDGSAYATSYKLQKLIEGFSPGEKPHLVFSGHYHKAMYAFIRGVHAFESGTLCGQTKFMRGKKLSAHMGFWCVEVEYDDTGVTSITPKFHPWFEHTAQT